MSPEDEDFCCEWERDLANRAWVRRMDRAIRMAQTPARLYSIARHRITPERPPSWGPRG